MSAATRVAKGVTGLAMTFLAACSTQGPGAEVPDPPDTNPSRAETAQGEDSVELSPEVSILPPNPWEQKVFDAFEELGIEGGIAEHGFRGATMSADWRGSRVLVRSRAMSQPGLKFDVLGMMAVGRVRVAIITNRTFGLSYRFTCHRTVYEVTRLQGDRDVVPSFVSVFIPAINCPSA